MVSYITWSHVTELFAQQLVEAYIEVYTNVSYYWSFVYRWILPTKVSYVVVVAMQWRRNSWCTLISVSTIFTLVFMSCLEETQFIT